MWAACDGTHTRSTCLRCMRTELRYREAFNAPCRGFDRRFTILRLRLQRLVQIHNSWPTHGNLFPGLSNSITAIWSDRHPSYPPHGILVIGGRTRPVNTARFALDSWVFFRSTQPRTKSNIEDISFPTLPDCPLCSAPTIEDELSQFGMCSQCRVSLGSC